MFKPVKPLKPSPIGWAATFRAYSSLSGIARALWLMTCFGAVMAFCGAMLWLFGREWLDAVELAFWGAYNHVAAIDSLEIRRHLALAYMDGRDPIWEGIRSAMLLAVNGLGGLVALSILNVAINDD